MSTGGDMSTGGLVSGFLDSAQLTPIISDFFSITGDENVRTDDIATLHSENIPAGFSFIDQSITAIFLYLRR